MSIFSEKYHDTLLLQYLSINDTVKLSQVNKYYHDLTKNILQPFKKLREIKNSEKYKIYVDQKFNIYAEFSINNLHLTGTYRNFVFNHNYFNNILKKIVIIIKACKYGNIRAIDYYCKKYINVMHRTLIMPLYFGVSKIVDDCNVLTVLELALCICIYCDNIEAINIICNLDIDKCIAKMNIMMKSGTIKYYCSLNSDQIINIINNCQYFAIKK